MQEVYIFSLKSLVYGIYRDYQKSRTYALRGNNSEWSQARRKPANKRYPETSSPTPSNPNKNIPSWKAPFHLTKSSTSRPLALPGSPVVILWIFKYLKNCLIHPRKMLLHQKSKHFDKADQDQWLWPFGVAKSFQICIACLCMPWHGNNINN